MNKTFKVPSYKIPALRYRIAELNKKAMKLMGEEVTFTMGIPYVEEVKDIGLVEFHDVSVDGPSPIINGWSIQLIIDHSNDQNIVIRVGDEPSDGWFDAANQCSHCHYTRKRNFTYLLRNEKDHELRQVGKTCLKDFTGHKSPEDIGRWATVFQEFDDEVTNESRDHSGSADHRRIPTMPYLAMVVAQVEDSMGLFITRKQVDEGSYSTSTASLALSAKLNVTDAHRALALKAVEHTISTADGSEFSQNLVRLVRFDTFDFRYSGIVAYAVGGYLRFLAANKPKPQAQMEGSYVSEIGVRSTYTLTKLYSREVNNFDSTLYVNVFVDAEGRTFVWTTGKNVGDDGETLTLKGTVKDHREFKGIKQTILSRCTIITK